MPDPQRNVILSDRWPIIVEFMGGPFDGGWQGYRETPPLSLLFPCRSRYSGDDAIDALRSCIDMEYDRYEYEKDWDSGCDQPVRSLIYHYMGKDRVEVPG